MGDDKDYTSIINNSTKIIGKIEELQSHGDDDVFTRTLDIVNTYFGYLNHYA